MPHYTRFLLLACLAAIACAASAQTTRYACSNLQQLAATLENDYGLKCDHPQTANLGRNRLVVAEDSLGRIDHIGWEIFPAHIVRENPSPVYRFVERYLLELYLCKQLPTPAQRLKEDKVTLRFPGHEQETLRRNIDQRLPHFGTRTSLLVLTDNNYYSVSVYEAGEPQFSIRFPIRYELLWGMNKKEAENSFYTNLAHYQSVPARSNEPLPPDKTEELVAEADNCFVLPGDSYIIGAMNNDCFYRRTAGGIYLPVCDTLRAEASVRNLFLLPCGEKVTASVKQRLYNRRMLEFDVPLHKLMAFCRAAGCRPYVGIETVTDEEVTGTVILMNPAYGYCHQLYFRVPTGILANLTAYKLQLELYAYVPTHNIGNLFYEREK